MIDRGQIPGIEQREVQNTFGGQFLDGWRTQRPDSVDPMGGLETRKRDGDRAAATGQNHTLQSESQTQPGHLIGHDLGVGRIAGIDFHRHRTTCGIP